MTSRIAALLFTLLTVTVVAEELDPRETLLGSWELDVAKTRESRLAVKKLPEGVKEAPDPAKIAEKTVIFDRQNMVSNVKGNTAWFLYTVMKVEGSSLYLRYQPTKPGEPPLFTRWEILGPNEAVNYLIVFSMKEPLLEDKTFATYYKRVVK